MNMRYLTAGESHGEALIGIIEGLPAGLKVDINFIDDMLLSRQKAVGRGSRSMTLPDKAKIMSGLHDGTTTGAPIAVILPNGNCGGKGEFEFFRPGHVDYVANKKYAYGDAALGAERASARETAIRTALGAIAMQMLNELGITIRSFTTQIGDIKRDGLDSADFEQKSKQAIDEAAKCGDTLGGKLKVIISGLKACIGSHVHYDRRLDYRLAGAFMSIPAVKGVECGMGSDFAAISGKNAADGLALSGGKIVRTSNNCGGIEGGISNGEDIIFTVTVKPVPSVADLPTINIQGNECVTGKVRGDVCAVPAACIVAQAVASLEVAAAIIECLGGDTMDEIKERYSMKGRK